MTFGGFTSLSNEFDFISLIRAKYGSVLIKEWSIKLTKLYGNGYDYTNLSRFRQFYIFFPKLATVWQY